VQTQFELISWLPLFGADTRSGSCKMRAIYFVALRMLCSCILQPTLGHVFFVLGQLTFSR